MQAFQIFPLPPLYRKIRHFHVLFIYSKLYKTFNSIYLYSFFRLEAEAAEAEAKALAEAEAKAKLAAEAARLKQRLWPRLKSKPN